MRKDATISKKPEVGAGVAGIGGGTLLVLLAKSLPDESSLKPWILFAAPSVAVGLRTLTAWGIKEITAFWNNWSVARRVRKAKQKVMENLQMDGTSMKHRAALMKKLEAVQTFEIDNELKELSLLGESKDQKSPKSVI